MFKPGDKVRMNVKYFVTQANKKKIWTVRTGPWMCCGTWVVLLEGRSSGYAVHGLDLVEAAK